MKKFLALCLALSLLLCGCAAEQPEAAATEPTVPVTQPPETEPIPTETEPEPTEPPVELHSGIREDGSFDEGTLFIGDSLTYGLLTHYLKENDLRGDCRYMATPGAATTVFFGGPKLKKNGEVYSFYSKEFEGMYMSEAAETAGESVTAIYFMMGTNYGKGASEQLYIDIFTHLLTCCPNATLYVQLVPFAYSASVEFNTANNWIKGAYGYFEAQGQQRIQLIDTHTAIGHNQTSDGIHLTEKGQKLWYEELLRYAQDNGIPQ